MDEETLIELIYIKNAPNRERVLKAFKDEEYIRPSDLAKRFHIHTTTISANLRKLQDRGYVYLINPEFANPRFYKLTERGKQIIEALDECE